MGGRRGHAPNRRLSGFFNGKNWLCWDCSLYQKCSVDLKYAKNALAAGAPPEPGGGAHDAPPNPVVRWGGVWGGDTPPQSLPRSLGAFGASIFAPSALSFCAPNVKSWLRPCPLLPQTLYLNFANLVMTVRRAVSVYARVSLFGAGLHVCQPSNFRPLKYPLCIFGCFCQIVWPRPILRQDVNQQKPCVGNRPNYILL